MTILTTSLLVQEIRLVPRGSFSILEITDEQTNVTTAINLISVISGHYYTTISALFELIENHNYTFQLKQGTSVMFKGKIFCTDQNLVTFSVNNDKYISNTTTNDFIVYE